MIICENFQGLRNEGFLGEAAKKNPFFLRNPLKYLFSISLKFGEAVTLPVRRPS